MSNLEPNFGPVRRSSGSNPGSEPNYGNPRDKTLEPIFGLFGFSQASAHPQINQPLGETEMLYQYPVSCIGTCGGWGIAVCNGLDCGPQVNVVFHHLVLYTQSLWCMYYHNNWVNQGLVKSERRLINVRSWPHVTSLIKTRSLGFTKYVLNCCNQHKHDSIPNI